MFRFSFFLTYLRRFVNRWVAKLKDGVSFGMEYCDIVELEEERWMLQASSLKVRAKDPNRFCAAPCTPFRAAPTFSGARGKLLAFSVE